jgi:hypothetical protein
MTSPNGLYEWLALAAAAAGAIALLLLIWIAFSLRRIRRAQKIVLGGSDRDITRHAESLQRDFIALRDWLDEASGQLDGRMKTVETRLDGAVAHTAMMRYDAFGAMSGRQSSSVALLDEHSNGVVLSAITHRSHSHLYVKQLTEGKSDIELSPEEQQVVDQAFAAPNASPPAPAQAARVVSQPADPPPRSASGLSAAEPTDAGISGDASQNPPAAGAGGR